MSVLLEFKNEANKLMDRGLDIPYLWTVLNEKPEHDVNLFWAEFDYVTELNGGVEVYTADELRKFEDHVIARFES